MKTGKDSSAGKLREKAEELLKSGMQENIPETDQVKLVHELKVHQIELELQNEELASANSIAQSAVKNYTELFDFTPACYFTLSREGEILNLNNSGAQMLGKEANNLIRSRFGFFVTTDTRETFDHFIDEVFTSKRKETCEIKIINNYDQPIYVYCVSLITTDGNACHMNVIDINDRHKAEENLRKLLNELKSANSEILQKKIEIEKQANKLNITNKELEQMVNLNSDKNRFISLLAHDLKNPFGVLLGFSEMLLENLYQYNMDEIEKTVVLINQNAQNTFALLENMLKWARLQSGRIPFEPEQTKMADLSDDVVMILKPFATSKNITLINSLSDQIYAFADRNMISAVLRNLVTNAIKFTHPHGVIEISAIPSGSNLTISVSDNGIGITPARLQILFDISHIQSTTGTLKENGTGLGLFICKEFVDKHGGKIWAKSEVGKGSVFYFTIPFKLEFTEVKIETAKTPEHHVKDLKILIVDDQYSLRLILSEMTKIFSREFLYAASGEEAVEICRSNHDIDLILMDFQLPEMNGLETAKKIRVINKEVKIIFQSGYEIKDILDKSDISYNIDYVIKPYNKHVLELIIKKNFMNTL